MNYCLDKIAIAKFALIGLVAIQLGACGGGGGGSTASTPAPAAAVSTVTPTALSTQVTTPSSTTKSNTASSFTINGNVVGLNSGAQLVLANGSDSLTVGVSGAFTFSQPVAANGSFLVTVSSQPVGQVCSVTNGTGSGVVANISDVTVNCSRDVYSVSGTVSGLTSGQSVTLLNNGAEAQIVSANGSFTSSAQIAYNGSFNITIGSQPAGSICTVSGGSGSRVIANVNSLVVTCSTIYYSVAGSVSGLATGQQVTLLNNGSDPTTVSANSSFSFSVPVANNSSYAVTVGTQPAGQECTVVNGSGSAVVANVSSVSVSCASSSSMIYSPYFYYGDYADSSHRLMTALTTTGSATQTMLSAMPANLTTGTWAFATGTCGSEMWGGYTTGAQFAAVNVPAFVAAGKKYIVSTGGGGNNFLCASGADLIKFIQTYYSANMVGLDFDIENTQTVDDVNNLVQAVVAAQAVYPNLRYSFTVSENGGNAFMPYKYTAYVMNAIKTYGLKNYTFNLMTMDFRPVGQASAEWCTLQTGAKLCEMGLSAVAAAKNIHNYWGVPYSQIELTPMIGGNDDADEFFTLADVNIVTSFVLENKLAGVHFWGFSRDKDCAPDPTAKAASDRCNSYGVAGTLGFTNAFLSGLGY